MFENDKFLKGGNGCKFNSDDTTGEMAGVDKDHNPGYLTYKATEGSTPTCEVKFNLNYGGAQDLSIVKKVPQGETVNIEKTSYTREDGKTFEIDGIDLPNRYQDKFAFRSYNITKSGDDSGVISGKTYTTKAGETNVTIYAQ